MSRNAKAWKFRLALLNNEEPGLKTLQNVKFSEVLASDQMKLKLQSDWCFLENDDVT